jgi:hypothetical protein
MSMMHRALKQLIRGLYGTNLIAFILFCDIIFSLMRIICYTQYVYCKKNQFCQVAWWWCGRAFVVGEGSNSTLNLYFICCKMYKDK